MPNFCRFSIFGVFIDSFWSIFGSFLEYFGLFIIISRLGWAFLKMWGRLGLVLKCYYQRVGLFRSVSGGLRIILALFSLSVARVGLFCSVLGGLRLILALFHYQLRELGFSYLSWAVIK